MGFDGIIPLDNSRTSPSGGHKHRRLPSIQLYSTDAREPRERRVVEQSEVAFVELPSDGELSKVFDLLRDVRGRHQRMAVVVPTRAAFSHEQYCQLRDHGLAVSFADDTYRTEASLSARQQALEAQLAKLR